MLIWIYNTCATVLFDLSVHVLSELVFHDYFHVYAMCSVVYDAYGLPDESKNLSLQYYKGIKRIICIYQYFVVLY